MAYRYSYEERAFDYSEFPDASAPRRFEVLNTNGEPYGHGAQFCNGMVVFTTYWEPIAIYPSIDTFPSPLRWLDPPFITSEEQEDE